MVIIEEIIPKFNLYYAIEPINKIRPFPGGTANSFYILETLNNKYVLKIRNPRYSNEEQLFYEHRLKEHLQKKGIPVPLAIPTRNGERWIAIDSRIYELYPYIEGKNFDNNSIPQLKSSAYTLAKFHLAVEDFPYKDYRKLPRYDSPSSIKQGLNELRDEIDKSFIDILYKIVERIEIYLPDEVYWSLPLFIIHGDYHPANLKFQEDMVVGIFDLDWTSLQPRVRDLADGILYIASRRKTLIDGSNIRSLTQKCYIDLERSKIFIEAYREVLNIKESEIFALPLFIEARWIFSRVDAAVRKIPKGEREEFIKDGLLEPVVWLEDYKDEFLKSLINS
ncbi:MAG: phosphotransferase [bacterium]|nr:phosphotransferase [bacterium]